MASSQPSPTAAEPPPLPPVKRDLLAGFLSYLIPGLGQVYQGRIGKGMLFFFGLYFLFFYGMWMGQWRNVWLPDTTDLPDVVVFGKKLGGVAKSAAYRPQFLAQCWIGVAAWPAIYQYVKFDPTKNEGPPPFRKFQRAPKEDELNNLQRNSSKRWDLGWVFTVIAGVLNLLVIYDAFAGPMFRDAPTWANAEESTSAAVAEPVVPMPLPADVPEDHVTAPNLPIPTTSANPNPQGGVS